MSDEFKITDTLTWTARLYVAGPIEKAKEIIRRECFPKGLCVTIEPTTYIFAGGEEVGYVVGMIDYPRYQDAHHLLFDKAQRLLETLVRETHQWSGTIVTPGATRFITRRPE